MSLARSVPTRIRLAASLMFLAALAACQTAADTSVPLTEPEVRSTFIGHAWSQGTGEFLFSEDGTWRYADTQTKVHGTYEIGEDGTVCATNAADSPSAGRRTCYTFYRDGDSYRYWHDRSGKFWPAYLR